MHDVLNQRRVRYVVGSADEVRCFAPLPRTVYLVFFTRLTLGGEAGLAAFYRACHSAARGSGTHPDIGAGQTPRPGLSLTTPLARSDPRGRGGGRDSDARTPNVTHTHAHPRSGEQHQRCSGPQSTPRDALLNLVLLTTMGR